MTGAEPVLESGPGLPQLDIRVLQPTWRSARAADAHAPTPGSQRVSYILSDMEARRCNGGPTKTWGANLDQSGER